jgi:hypothetical protein
LNQSEANLFLDISKPKFNIWDIVECVSYWYEIYHFIVSYRRYSKYDKKRHYSCDRSNRDFDEEALVLLNKNK